MRKWFVILRWQSGIPVALIEDVEFNTIVLFDSKKEAIDAAENNPMGNAYGYEVIEWTI